VLKPEGQLIIEDLSIETFDNNLGKIFRKLLYHPYSAMYKHEEFLSYLEKIGFKIKIKKVFNPLDFAIL